MGRLIFNSSMGIVGARGKIATDVAFKDKQGNIIVYAGAYSRKDVRGTCNILCKLPNNYDKEPTANQIAQRNKFRDAVAQMIIILNDPEQAAAFRAAWKAQPNFGTDRVKYPTLRGYILNQLLRNL